MKSSGIITLTTDFGLQDPYVGIMKGVILSISPEARVIDISHQIRAGSIFQASYLIQEAYPFFPKGTVHVAVIDPGVGGERRPIIIDAGEHIFVGPDNGLFWPIIKSHQEAPIIHLTKEKYFLPEISHTFHGRDIFAPVAAHLWRGVDPSDMGIPINDPVQLQLPMPRRKGDLLSGQVIRVDRFGNLITNIHRKELEEFLGNEAPVIQVGNQTIEGVLKTYNEAGPGEILTLIGSSDYLEIAVNLGRACDFLGLDSEDPEGIPVEVSNVKGHAK
jgi:hypothetical protein